MALTRKMLKAMGIEDEKIDEIIDAHRETVDALKDERDGLKESADKLTETEKKLEKANADLAKYSEAGEMVSKSEYDKIKTEYDSYKADIEKKKTDAEKEHAYRELLKSAGVSEKRIDAVMKVSKLDEIELDEKGQIKDLDKKTESIKTEWADFIEDTHEGGADFSKHQDGEKETDELSNLSMEEYITARSKQMKG